MGLNFDGKKISKNLAEKASVAKEVFAGAAETTKDKAATAANAAGNAIATGKVAAAKKASTIIQNQKERWYSPLFLEEYQADDFDMPKLVVIADEDSRKDVELCDGAIGWINRRKVPEIIFLYENFLPECGIRFNPRPICGSAYFRHPFEHDLYLQVKDYLTICLNNQLTKLKNIACQLGAVHCSVEIHQEKGLIGTLGASRSAHAQAKEANQSASTGAIQSAGIECGINETLSIVMDETFVSGVTPQRPALKWFKHDNEILSLIEKRCSSNMGGVLNTYSIDITASATSTISIDLANSIDASLGAAKVKAGESLSAGLKKEEKKRFVYRIEF